MSEKASEVLSIKVTMDLEVAQYCGMALPPAFRNELIKRTVSHRMEQATQLLERFLTRYDSAQNHRSI